jgi:cytochrome d ubiquinol oxidase subunit II
MEAIWFAIISVMLAVYVVLDGFDFGVGIVHRFVARTDAERRTVLAAIGPVWDGNEVWLIAAGGVLFMAFPRVYATSFSGFYLALMIVLWLLILRGVSIELRSHIENPLWREWWDTVFSVASSLLALVLGTALGNVVRGVPISAEGLPGMPLFTNFRTGTNPGLFDWYTALIGLFAVTALAAHGALYLCWRTNGAIQVRCRAFAETAWKVVIGVWFVATIATAFIRFEVFSVFASRPWAILLVLAAVVGLIGVFRFHKQERDLAAFLASSAFLLGLMAAAMVGIYPNWLISTIDPAYSLTADNSAAAPYGLRSALAWWSVGITLAIGYFVFLYRSIREKVRVVAHDSHAATDEPGNGGHS